MAFVTQTSTLAPNHRLEVSLNITRVAPDGSFYYEMIVGIRRDGGVGVNGSAVWAMGVGGLPSGSASGEEVTISYDLRSATYQEIYRIPNRHYLRTPDDTDTQFRANATTTTSAPGNPLGPFSLTATVDLPAPSQASFPSFSPASFVAGTPISISWTAAQSTYRHTLRYSFGPDVNFEIESGIIGSQSGYSYTPPAYLLSYIPDAPSAPYTISLETFTAGGTSLGVRSVTGELRAPSTGPTVTAVSVSDTNAAVASQVGAFVQGLSVLRLDGITATAPEGATVTERRLDMASQNLRIGETRALLEAGTRPYTARAWDSRGREGSLAGSVNVLPYSGPELFLPFPPPEPGTNAYRSTATGEYDAEGSHLSVLYSASVASLVNGTQRNSLTVRISTKPFDGDTWTVRNTVTPAVSASGGRLSTGHLTLVVGGGAIYSPDESYVVRIEILDKFNTLTRDDTIPTAYVTLDLNGSGVGVGKLHERGALDVGGAGYFEGVYSRTEVVGDADAARHGGRYAVTSETVNLPAGFTGSAFLEVTRFEYIPGAIDTISQDLRPFDLNSPITYRRFGLIDIDDEGYINWESGWSPAALPEPQGVNGPSVQTITATSWADVPNIPTISLTLPQPAWVRVEAFGWLQGGGGDVRAGVALSGATTLAANEAYGSLAWGTVLWAQNAYLQGSTSKLVRCDAGTTVFRMQGYHSGSGTHQLNYSTMVVSPERWAA